MGETKSMEIIMQDNRFANPAQARATQIDAGLRAYMLGVYNHMTTALGITGFAAFGTKLLATASPAFAQLLFGSPLMYVVMFAPLGMVMWLSFSINAMSPAGTDTVLQLCAGDGYFAINHPFAFTGASVARAFFITAGAFAALSIYGYTTKRDLSAFGAFYCRRVWSDTGVNRQYLCGKRPDGI